MKTFFEKLQLVLHDQVLRKRIFFTLGFLLVSRLLSAVPIPGVDVIQLENFLSSSQFFGFLNIFSGGGLSNLSIVLLGVGPYITSSIIMQLLTMMSPKLKALYHEEGEAGRLRFTQYSRFLTVPLAIIQGLSFLIILERQGVLLPLTTFDFVVNVVVVVAGSLLLMWIGELITEFGIGNGVSLLIFAGIVAGLPSIVQQSIFLFDVSQIPMYIGI